MSRLRERVHLPEQGKVLADKQHQRKRSYRSLYLYFQRLFEWPAVAQDQTHPPIEPKTPSTARSGLFCQRCEPVAKPRRVHIIHNDRTVTASNNSQRSPSSAWRPRPYRSKTQRPSPEGRRRCARGCQGCTHRSKCLRKLRTRRGRREKRLGAGVYREGQAYCQIYAGQEAFRFRQEGAAAEGQSHDRSQALRQGPAEVVLLSRIQRRWCIGEVPDVRLCRVEFVAQQLLGIL